MLLPMAQYSLTYREAGAKPWPSQILASQLTGSLSCCQPRVLKSWGSAFFKRASSQVPAVRYSKASAWLLGEKPRDITSSFSWSAWLLCIVFIRMPPSYH